MVPPRTSQTTLLSLLGVPALAGTVAVQNPESVPQLSPMFRVGGSFLIDLVVGGILVVAAPSYTRDAIAEARDDPDGSFPWGFGVSIDGVIVLVLLAITIIGFLVAISGFLALVLLSIVGGAVSTVFLGAPVPILGSVILLVVDMLGLGVVGRNLVRSWV